MLVRSLNGTILNFDIPRSHNKQIYVLLDTTCLSLWRPKIWFRGNIIELYTKVKNG